MVSIINKTSHLRPDANGKLKVRLIQAKAGGKIMGLRHGFRDGQILEAPDPDELAEFARLLGQTEEGELAILSLQPGVVGSRENLRDLSKTRTIVTLGGIDAQLRNLTLVATGGEIVEQAKMSLASEDHLNEVVAGDTLHVFDASGASDAVRWAVLNCHDYTHATLLQKLLEQRIELIVVVTYNAATRLYWEYATADIHRLFCHVVIVNIAEMGGSGVFVPVRSLGSEPNARYGAMGQIFGVRGPVETTATVELDIGELRALRIRYRTNGLAGAKDPGDRNYTPVYPSEHFTASWDREAGPPPIDEVDDHQLEWNSDNPLVAIAQLRSIDVSDYVATEYRLDRVASVATFEKDVAARLADLKAQLERRSPDRWPLLDFLVFPEVFLPRRFAEGAVTQFVKDTGAIALCGVDYPGSTTAENRNSCLVLGPGGFRAEYDKITRSQYDAMGPEQRLNLNRGRRLHRFVNSEGHAFGVLICYDFSHFELVRQINCERRDEPLDAMFVVAHNPFSALYRACCVADSHRFYQHVIMCNVAQYGGSGVFAPQRTSGTRQTLIEVGMKTEAIALVELDLARHRTARGMTDELLHEGTMMRKPGTLNHADL